MLAENESAQPSRFGGRGRRDLARQRVQPVVQLVQCRLFVLEAGGKIAFTRTSLLVTGGIIGKLRFHLLQLILHLTTPGGVLLLLHATFNLLQSCRQPGVLGRRMRDLIAKLVQLARKRFDALLLELRALQENLRLRQKQ